MKALLSNDDGYLSLALIELNRICKKHFDTVSVIAPDRNCSGASSALTLRNPIYIHRHTNGFVSVEGTPADCVHIGLQSIFSTDFDIVISGINLGANVGDDVIYSGTLAAAIEGRFLSYPSIALSIASATPKYYECAEYVIDLLINKIKKHKPTEKIIFNVNIPNIPLSELKGVKVTRLGSRKQAGIVEKIIDKYGCQAYKLGSPGDFDDSCYDTDIYAIENNYASITPIDMDFTKHNSIESVSDWLTKY